MVRASPRSAPALLALITVLPLWAACAPGEAPTDAGAQDAGAPDAGAADAGPDSGFDAGRDAGVIDAGASDAGFDAGFDAGPPPPDPDGGPTVNAYWASVGAELTGAALVAAVHSQLAATHTTIAYDDLYAAYESTDYGRDGCVGIFDFYSTRCWQVTEACGNYSAEGDCFNREHSWPRSWWGSSENIDAFSDLHHVIPTDGYVNNRRGNLPFGVVDEPIYASTNGSEVGPCVTPGIEGNCFEPKATLKGDFARIYFYVAMRYEGELDCCDVGDVDGANIGAVQEGVLRLWHNADLPDADERLRNDAVFAEQGNRNPFVDHPSWVWRVADF